jgi:hypothetical protein
MHVMKWLIFVINFPQLAQASKKQKLVQGLAVTVLGPFCFCSGKEIKIEHKDFATSACALKKIKGWQKKTVKLQKDIKKV